MHSNKDDKKVFDLDLIGLSLKDASEKIYQFDPEIRLSIHETKSYKDHDYHNIYDGTIVRQENKKKSISLTIAYF